MIRRVAEDEARHVRDHAAATGDHQLALLAVRYIAAPSADGRAALEHAINRIAQSQQEAA